MPGLRIDGPEEKCGAWGRLTLRYFRQGKLIYEDAESNVLTNAGKNLWVKRLRDGQTAKGVDRMEAGDGGCLSTALYTPIPFTATDTALRDPVNLAATIEAGEVYDTGARTVTYKTVLAAALAQPADFHYTPRVINELALVTASPDNIVVALRAFKSMIFDPNDAIEIEAEWEIGLL